MADDVVEVIWILSLLKEMHNKVVDTLKVWCDNSGVVALQNTCRLPAFIFASFRRFFRRNNSTAFLQIAEKKTWKSSTSAFLQTP